MKKNTKILATLGPSILNKSKLIRLINNGVDAFRINFSHNIDRVAPIIKIIRQVEKNQKKHIAIVADLQGIKPRIGKVTDDHIKINFNQKFVFDLNKHLGNSKRVCFPYPKIIRKIKKGKKILIDDGKFTFKVIKKQKNSLTTICQSHDCYLKSYKSLHTPNLNLSVDKLTAKDKKDIKTARKIGCNWMALSFIQNSKIIKETRKLINPDMGIIAKIENRLALKNIEEITTAADAIMIARGDLAIDVGHSEVPKIQMELIKKCSKLSKPAIVATQMLESMIKNDIPTRAEINDIATAIFQGADAVMLSAETAIGRYPIEAVIAMKKTIVTTEKYKKEHIEQFKSSIKTKGDLLKSMILSIKDLAYNQKINTIIAFSNSGKTAKLVSSIRPSAKIIAISPNVNICRQLSLIWGVKTINNKDARNWNDMMKISKDIIKRDRTIEKNDFVVITTGLPFGKAKMTNMIRLYQVES